MPSADWPEEQSERARSWAPDPASRSPTLRAVEMDVELLSRVRNGDEEAFVMLVARYQQPMLRLARSMVPSQAVAEEAVQDTWLGVVRGIERFEGRSSFKTWLFRILVNRARSAGSREPLTLRSRRPAVDPTRFDAQGSGPIPSTAGPRKARTVSTPPPGCRSSKAALDELPPRQRQVVMLRDVEGLSNDEACACSGSVRATSGSCCTAAARLREILEARDGEG